MGRYSFIGVDPTSSFDGCYADFRGSFPEQRPQHPDLPPFTGGAVGIFCYDMVRELERLPDRGTEGREAPGMGPASVLMDFYPDILAFDHLKHQIIILSHQGNQRIEELEARLFGKVEGERLGKRVSDVAGMEKPGFSYPLGEVPSNFTEEGFCAAVQAAKEYIVAGDIFQVVLSQRFEIGF